MEEHIDSAQQVSPNPPTPTHPPVVIKKEQKKGGDIGWALFLIFIGSMLFLNTTGMVDWNVWPYLLRFWPVFLIFAGIQVIFGRYSATRWIISLFSLVIFIILGVTAIAIVQPDFLNRFNIHLPQWWLTTMDNKGEEKTESTSIKKSDFSTDANVLALNLTIGYGSFTMSDESDPSNMLVLNETYYDNFGRVNVDTEQEGPRAKVSIDQESGRMWGFHSEGSSYDMVIDQTLPIDLNIDLGAGKGSIEFTDAVVRSFDADIGAGELIVDFSEQSLSNVQAFKAHVGAGKLVLALPEEVGLTIEHSVGVGSITLNNEKLPKSDDGEFRSDNFANVVTKVELSLDVGVGSIELIYK